MKRQNPVGFFLFALTALLGFRGETLSAGGALPPCPPGWAHDNWYDPTVQTPKYVVGRILAAHPHTPEGLRQALPAIQAAFPGSKILPGTVDILYVAGVGDIDVIAGAATGGRSWRWHVLRDECAQSGLCSPPHKGPAAAGGTSATGGGSSSGGAGANGRFTCNKWKDNADCWCGEWTDAIWAQRHYVSAHVCRPGFTLSGHSDERWGSWAREEVGQFIRHMESLFGSDNHNCRKSGAAPDWDEVERRYWQATAFSGLSGTGLADIGKACKAGGSSGGSSSKSASTAGNPASTPASSQREPAAPAAPAVPEGSLPAPVGGREVRGPAAACADTNGHLDTHACDTAVLNQLNKAVAPGFSEADAVRYWGLYRRLSRTQSRRDQLRPARRSGG